MAAVCDSSTGYLSLEPIFKVAVDEGDEEPRFLRNLTPGFDEDASDPDFDSSSDDDSGMFYNVFYTEVPGHDLRIPEATDDTISGVFRKCSRVGSNGAEDELGLGFSDGSGSSPVARMELRSDGRQFSGVGSESDSEKNENDESGDELSYADDFDPFDVLDCGLRWDSPQMDDQGIFDGNNEWEEAIERNDAEREAFSMLADGTEHLSAPSEISSEESWSDDISDDVFRDIEWAVLLSANNMGMAYDFHADRDAHGDGDGYLPVLEESMVVEDYGAVFWLLEDDEFWLNGNPPAAKSAVDNLRRAVLSEDFGNKEEVHCAVCKNEILFEEKVLQLPCCHYFHGECILPWLDMRNTCPVCRYEFPTDDPEYEQRRCQRVGGPGPRQNLQVG